MALCFSSQIAMERATFPSDFASPEALSPLAALLPQEANVVVPMANRVANAKSFSVLFFIIFSFALALFFTSLASDLQALVMNQSFLKRTTVYEGVYAL